MFTASPQPESQRVCMSVCVAEVNALQLFTAQWHSVKLVADTHTNSLGLLNLYALCSVMMACLYAVSTVFLDGRECFHKAL